MAFSPSRETSSSTCPPTCSDRPSTICLVETTSAAGCYFLLRLGRQPKQAPSPAAKLAAMETIGPLSLGVGMVLATAAALAVTMSASAPPPSPAPWWPKMGLAGA